MTNTKRFKSGKKGTDWLSGELLGFILFAQYIIDSVLRKLASEKYQRTQTKMDHSLGVVSKKTR